MKPEQKWLISWIGERYHTAAEGALIEGDSPIANARKILKTNVVA